MTTEEMDAKKAKAVRQDWGNIVRHVKVVAHMIANFDVQHGFEQSRKEYAEKHYPQKPSTGIFPEKPEEDLPQMYPFFG